MTAIEFQNEMGRLVRVFGEGQYKTERTQMIWEIVKDEDAGWWKRAVDEFIGSCRQAPLLPEVRESLAKNLERHNKKSHSREIVAGYACDYCRDNGVYLCKHPERGGVWAFRCHCMRGRQDERHGIPHYTATHAAEGYRFHDMFMTTEGVA